MEFHFRAGDERCPSTGATATSANSETAATRVHVGLVGDDGVGYHGESSPPSESDPNDLRRREAKERIRERILSEEAEAMALEAEVRRELMEERASLLAMLAGGSEHRTAPPVASLKTATLHFHESVQAESKVEVSAVVPGKRKNHDVHDTSVVLAATGSKKSKPNLSCMVCDITATSEVSLQEHLRGKSHGRKAAKLAQPLPGTGQPMEDAVCSKPAKRKNSDVVPAASTLSAGPSSKNQKQDHLKGKAHMKMAASLAPAEAEEEAEVQGGYTPWKFKMLTDSGTLCEVVQLNGSILCEVCDKQTLDRVTMMAHLQGTKHISKQAKQKQCQAVEPPAAVAAGGVGRVDGGSLLCELCNVKVASECAMQSHLSGRKHTNKAKVAALGVGASGNGSGSENVPMEANGVRRLSGGILLCQLCDVKAPSEFVMRTHLSGRKHTNKQKATADTGAGQEVKKTAAVATIGSSSKEATSIVVNGSDESVKKPGAGEMEVAVSSAKPQVDVARVSSVAPMEVDEGAEAGDGTAKADEQERADAEEDGAAKAEEEEKADAEEEGAMEIDGGRAVTGEEYYIKVQGKLFVTLRQADDSLSCGLCGVHGCDKRGMINHILTSRDHWRRARLAEEKKRAAQEAVSKDGDGVPVTGGEVHVDN